MPKNIISQNTDIHDYEGKVLLCLNKIKTDPGISELNKKYLLEYSNALLDFAAGTRSKNLQVVYKMAKDLKATDLKQVSIEQMKEYIYSIKNNELLTKWTVQKYLVCIKRFYRWLFGMKKHKYPEVVDWIDFSKPKNHKLPEKVLTPEDVKKAIQACNTAKARFIVSAFYDLGNRISELGACNIEHIQDKTDDNKQPFLVFSLPESKTQPRALPVRNCRPYLLDYLGKEHPKPEADQPLLVDKYGNRMKYEAVRKTFFVALKKAGIGKPGNPHHWRRSAATNYGQYFTESELDTWFGWGRQKTYSFIPTSKKITNNRRSCSEYKGLLTKRGREKERRKKIFKLKLN